MILIYREIISVILNCRETIHVSVILSYQGIYTFLNTKILCNFELPGNSICHFELPRDEYACI